MCQGMAIGFGLTESEGDNLYYFYLTNTDLSQTFGFDTTYYNAYELDVAAVIDGFLPTESLQDRTTLTVAARNHLGVFHEQWRDHFGATIHLYW